VLNAAVLLVLAAVQGISASHYMHIHTYPRLETTRRNAHAVHSHRRCVLAVGELLTGRYGEKNEDLGAESNWIGWIHKDLVLVARLGVFLQSRRFRARQTTFEGIALAGPLGIAAMSNCGAGTSVTNRNRRLGGSLQAQRHKIINQSSCMSTLMYTHWYGMDMRHGWIDGWMDGWSHGGCSSWAGHRGGGAAGDAAGGGACVPSEFDMLAVIGL
jgi:hypothetical protein